MSETIRVRLLLARFYGDSDPVVIAAIDGTVWEHWEDADESAWRAAAQRAWGMEPSDCEYREAWASFAPDDLVAAFEVPVAHGRVEPVEEATS